MSRKTRVKRRQTTNRRNSTESNLVQWVTGGIHGIVPVDEQPTTTMTRWGLYQVRDAEGNRSRHLVGRADDEGRVCSAIVQFDLERLTATTQSGRVYQLRGLPGTDSDASYVFSRWLRSSGYGRVRFLTRALIRLRQIRGMAPVAPYKRNAT